MSARAVLLIEMSVLPPYDRDTADLQARCA
jgi:hypothetical protein